MNMYITGLQINETIFFMLYEIYNFVMAVYNDVLSNSPYILVFRHWHGLVDIFITEILGTVDYNNKYIWSTMVVPTH